MKIRYESLGHAVLDRILGVLQWLAGWFHPAAGEVDSFRRCPEPAVLVDEPEPAEGDIHVAEGGWSQ